MAADLTLLDGAAATAVDADISDGRVLLSAAEVQRATGWEHKPEGMCRDGVCVPLRDPDVVAGDRLDLERLAAALQRPFAVDHEERVAALGTPAQERGESLASLLAPEFTLPDLDGRMHSLSGLRGRKVLLIAYASW
jgi:hypothetical protein